MSIVNSSPRLLAAAKEFNIGKATVVEFLLDNGFEINGDQNPKLSETMYSALQVEFVQDKLIRDISTKIELPKGSMLPFLLKLRDGLTNNDNPRTLEQNLKLEKQKANLEKQRLRRLEQGITSEDDYPPPIPKLIPPLFNDDELVHFEDIKKI